MHLTCTLMEQAMHMSFLWTREKQFIKKIRTPRYFCHYLLLVVLILNKNIKIACIRENNIEEN